MIKYEWRTSLDPQEAAELADLLDRAARHDAEAEHNTIDVSDVARTLTSENVRHLVIWMLPYATALAAADEPERIAGLVRVVGGAGGAAAGATGAATGCCAAVSVSISASVCCNSCWLPLSFSSSRHFCRSCVSKAWM